MNLSPLTTPTLLFWHLGVLPRHGHHCLRNMNEHVEEHVITTNGGRKRRSIYAPSRQLSWVQNRIRERMLLSLTVEDCVHGFVRGRGIVTNARVHAGQRIRWVVNIDLKNFFPSIGHRRVRGLVKRVFDLNDVVASSLTRLVTYDKHLAQGFCTSPDLANFMAWKLDRRLMGLASNTGMFYTRYADDLTFSIPHGVDYRPHKLVQRVSSIVVDEGFVVNDKKIAIMGSGRRQKVTGLVVSEHGAKVPRAIRRLLRSAVYHWRQQTPERRQSILGWINFVNAVDPEYAARLRAEIDTQRNPAKDVPTHPFAIDIGGVR